MATPLINEFPGQRLAPAGSFTISSTQEDSRSFWEDYLAQLPPGDLLDLIQEAIRMVEENLRVATQRLDAPSQPVENPTSPEAAIALIKSSLGLTVAELGGLFQVSRQAVYDWKKERTPMNENTWDKVLNLAASAQHWQKLTEGKAPRFLLDRRDPAESESILELCQGDQPEWQKIREQMSRHWDWYQASLNEAFEEIGYDAPVVRSRRGPGPSETQKQYAEFRANLPNHHDPKS